MAAILLYVEGTAVMCVFVARLFSMQAFDLMQVVLLLVTIVTLVAGIVSDAETDAYRRELGRAARAVKHWKAQAK